MKTFEDLVFEEHGVAGFGTRARMDYDNGYGVSVVTGGHAYSSQGLPYEVAVFKDGSLCYDTPITDDVIGHCDAAKVTEIMRQVQDLPNS